MAQLIAVSIGNNKVSVTPPTTIEYVDESAINYVDESAVNYKDAT